MAERECKDCVAEGVTTRRPAPRPGPRCETHHRAFQKSQRFKAAMARVENVYGLLPGDYQGLHQWQGGRCAICQRATGRSKRLAVDHNHRLEDLGRVSVRGLLCSTCNQMLGHARDDVQFFVRAARYLLEPPAQKYFLDTQPGQGA